ncbi:MAG: cell envelope integrity protein TolA [Burkholderiaceae bacterium]|nr:MAG: cell envelope integrity protein TolA [Burkholderiaceae bacterium]
MVRGTDAAQRSAPPDARGGGARAFALALTVHLLLVAMLVFGVRWQSRPPAAVQAELWVPPPPASVPVPAVPQPAPEPAPAKPAPEPPPARPAPQPEVERPDIVLERQKERERLERERLEREVAEAERKRREARLADERRRADEKRQQEKQQEARRREAEAQRQADAKKEAEAKKLADAKKDAEAKKQAQAKKDAEARKEAEAKKEADARKAAELKAQQQAAERSREDYVKRLMSQAGTAPAKGAPTGSASGSPTGTAAAGGAAGGADGDYAGRLSALIRSNTVFQIPPELGGNPKAVFLVSVLPDCTIASVKLRRSSGHPAWDQAAERGIQRSDPLPRMKNGSCPRELEISSGPRDER